MRPMARTFLPAKAETVAVGWHVQKYLVKNGYNAYRVSAISYQN